MAPPEEAGGGDQFPVGMKVLVVDDDPTCLAVLNRMLVQCRYDGERAAFAPISSLPPPPLLRWCAGPMRVLFCPQLVRCSSDKLDSTI
jgi:hypothetical protein